MRASGQALQSRAESHSCREGEGVSGEVDIGWGSNLASPPAVAVRPPCLHPEVLSDLVPCRVTADLLACPPFWEDLSSKVSIPKEGALSVPTAELNLSQGGGSLSRQAPSLGRGQGTAVTPRKEGGPGGGAGSQGGCRSCVPERRDS